MIKIDKINKIFNPHSRNRNHVLNDVTFELPEKGLVCIYGKSGSGKTTLLNIIGGLDYQDSGKIVIDGKEVGKDVDKIRNQNIGFVFQNYYLERGYTIQEIMHNAMVIAGFKDENEISKRTKEVLELVDMERFKNKQGDSLSGGQKQRVAIARALVKGADILLADEPTGNLDAENTFKIMDIFKEISKTKLVVIVTHEVTLIKKYADSYIQLVDGKLTDEDVIGEVFKYETDKNNIYVDESTSKNIKAGDVNLKVYGAPTTKLDDIQLYEDNGKVFLTVGKNVTVIDNKSEKKLVFKGNENEPEKIERNVPNFSKSTSKHNGRLFTIKNILKSQKKTSTERAYSTANIFKQVFVSIISVVMCFIGLMSFEVLRVNVENKMLNPNSVYVDLNAYGDLKRLNEDLYQKVDFFETLMRKGNFSYNDLTALSGIKVNYVPKAIEENDTKESLKLVYGNMPKQKQVLITRTLAENLKKEFRIEELNTDKAMTLVLFENKFAVSGIIEGGNPAVYMDKQDYVNFLGVYNAIQFKDPKNIFFSKDYINNTFTSEIVVSENSSEMDINETYIELSRNALYKMMEDTIQADFNVQKANSSLRSTIGRTSLEIAGSNLYVRKFGITREPIESDIRIHINSEALKNIFVYLEPNINSLNSKKDSFGVPNQSYFEITTKGGEQLENLNALLDSKNIPKIDITERYADSNEEAIKEATNKLTIFFVVIVLLFLVFFFIEKSGSLKNSKEYGIYRAIGVRKSNLLYKEGILALFNNMIGYSIVYLITSILMCVRYAIINVPVGTFIGILIGIYLLSSLIMIGISLIPYLFVLTKTPSEILARYDI